MSLTRKIIIGLVCAIGGFGTGVIFISSPFIWKESSPAAANWILSTSQVSQQSPEIVEKYSQFLRSPGTAAQSGLSSISREVEIQKVLDQLISSQQTLHNLQITIQTLEKAITALQTAGPLPSLESDATSEQIAVTQFDAYANLAYLEYLDTSKDTSLYTKSKLEDTFLKKDLDLEDLDDVSIDDPSTGQVLKWNGSKWVAGTDNEGSGADVDDGEDADTTYSAGSGLSLAGTTFSLGGALTEDAEIDLNGFALALVNGDLTIDGNQVCDSSGNCGTGSIWSNTSNVYHPAGAAAEVADLVIGGNSTASAKFRVVGSGTEGGYAYGARFVDTANSDYFVQPGSTGVAGSFAGNVGIGTSSPSQALDIDGSVRARGFRFYNGVNETVISANAGAALSIVAAGNAADPGISFSGSRSNISITGISADRIPLRINAHASQTAAILAIQKNSTDVFMISSASNVGIGTTNPLSRVDIATGQLFLPDGTSSAPSLAGRTSGSQGTGVRWEGNIALLSSDGFDFFSWGSGTGQVSLLRHTRVNSDLDLLNGGRIISSSKDIEITPASGYNTVITRGNVGIGTTAPVGKLNVEGAATGKALSILNETGNQDILTASSSGTTRFTLSNTGNIGLGTTNPQYKIDVAGTGSSGTFAIRIRNTSSAAGGTADFRAENDLNHYASFSKMVSSFGNYKILNNNDFAIYNSNGSGNISILNDYASGQIFFAAGGSSTTHLAITAAGNIGIGTSGTTAKLQVVPGQEDGGIFIDAEGLTSFNRVVSLRTNENSAIRYSAGSGAYVPHFLITGATYAGTGGRVSFRYTSYTAFDQIEGENYTERMRINNTGNIGVSTTDPTERLDVNGNARFRTVGTGSFSNELNITADGTLTTTTSDVRKKTNISAMGSELDKVLQLQPSYFNWIDDPSGQKDIGFIAQDVALLYPEIVFTNPVDGYMGINYNRFAAVLTRAIQEQHMMINTSNTKIAQLSTKDTQFDQQLATVSKSLGLNDTQVLGQSTERTLLTLIEVLSSKLLTLENTISQLSSMAEVTDYIFFKLPITFHKAVTFSQPIKLNENTAGSFSIPKSTNEVTITYTGKFSETPMLYISFDRSAPEYHINDETETGFTISFETATTEAIELRWLAVLRTESSEEPLITLKTTPETEQKNEPAEEGESGSENDHAAPIGTSDDITETSTRSALQATISGELNN